MNDWNGFMWRMPAIGAHRRRIGRWANFVRAHCLSSKLQHVSCSCMLQWSKVYGQSHHQLGNQRRGFARCAASATQR